MNHVIAVKSKKIGRKNTNKVSADLYKAVQEKCKSIPKENLEHYSDIIPVVCMRTTYSNQVVKLPSGGFHRSYDIMLDQGDRDLYSLCMLSCKQFLIDALQKTNGEVPMTILSESIAYPIGMTFIDNKYFLLSHIVIDDKVTTLPEFELNGGFSLADISSLEPRSALERALYERLLLIKEEPKKDE